MEKETSLSLLDEFHSPVKFLRQIPSMWTLWVTSLSQKIIVFPLRFSWTPYLRPPWIPVRKTVSTDTRKVKRGTKRELIKGWSEDNDDGVSCREWFQWHPRWPTVRSGRNDWMTRNQSNWDDFVTEDPVGPGPRGGRADRRGRIVETTKTEGRSRGCTTFLSPVSGTWRIC